MFIACGQCCRHFCDIAYKTLAKVTISIKCKHPRPELVSAVSHWESLNSVMLRLSNKINFF
jgi:hypothetical protein